MSHSKFVVWYSCCDIVAQRWLIDICTVKKWKNSTAGESPTILIVAVASTEHRRPQYQAMCSEQHTFEPRYELWTQRMYLKETIGWWSSGPRRSWCASSRMVVFATIDRIIKTVFVDGGVGVGALPVGYLELWWLTNIFVKRVLLLKMRGVEGSWFLRSQGPFLFLFFFGGCELRFWCVC